MAYDRYDSQRGQRDPSRFQDERWREGGERYREGSGGREERGFFERAGDQIASWFGDEDDDGRGFSRDRMGARDRDQGGWSAGRQPQGWGSRTPRDREYGRDRDHAGDREFGADRDFRRDRGDQGSYRPVTGDYGRSEGMASGSGYGRGGYGDRQGGSAGSSESNWDRDDYRRTSFAGSSEHGQSHDPHYHQWRQRQIEALDRDYDEYRREHHSKFENDFGSWRSNRQTKRQMLGQIREHMEVVGNDDEPVGKVDCVTGDRIILTKSDEAAGGAHHSLSCTDIDRVEGDRVILSSSADQARSNWRDESSERALFERERQGESQSANGPHMLDRSFSGTYR